MKRWIYYWRYRQKAAYLALIARMAGFDAMVRYGDARGWLGEVDRERKYAQLKKGFW